MLSLSCICGGLVEIPAGLAVASLVGLVGAAKMNEEMAEWTREELEDFVHAKSKTFLLVILGLSLLILSLLGVSIWAIIESTDEHASWEPWVLGAGTLLMVVPLSYYLIRSVRSRRELLKALDVVEET